MVSPDKREAGEQEPLHPEGLTENQERVALLLFEIGAIKFGAFRLKLHEENPEAPLSPYYVDLRVLPYHPQILKEVVGIYAQLAQKANPFDVCLGIPEAGNPLATAFALETNTPQIYLRKEAKVGHGIEGNFMTPFNPSEKVLVIDDLVTKAGSKLEIIPILEEVGLQVSDFVVLVDREQGGVKQLAEAGYTIHAAYRFSQLLDYYYRTGKIDGPTYWDCKAYFSGKPLIL